MHPTPIRIQGRAIAPGAKPFVIAEMSGNHNQSLDRALAIVDAAASAGVDALKIQTYTADTMTLDLKEGDFWIDDPNSLWSGKSLYQLYQEAHTPWEWHAPIFERCRQQGIIGFSTPFDVTAVDFLESLGVPAYKIASFESGDHALIRKVAATGKPMIISTGMATVADLHETVRVAQEAGCRDLALLKCTSSYPATPAHSHLRTIPHLQDLFGLQVGLSDHTLGLGVAAAAVALGATVIEKHFTLDRSEGGVDAAFSLEPAEMAALVAETERAWQALGEIRYGDPEAEQGSMRFRRSLYVVQDMKAGEAFTEKNLRAIRPGFGLAPRLLGEFIGLRAVRDIPRGTPLSWDLVK